MIVLIFYIMPDRDSTIPMNRRGMIALCGATVGIAGCTDTDTDNNADSGSTDTSDSGSSDTADTGEEASDTGTGSSDEETTDPVEPGELSIATVGSPVMADHDEDVTVDITVENIGDETVTEMVTVELDGDNVATDTVEIPADAEHSLELTIPADATTDGSNSVTVTTASDESTSILQITNPNPYGKETLVVGLTQETAARHDIGAIVRDSLDYWERYSEEYAGYPIEYDYRANENNPDIEIRLVESITDCGDHTGEVAGCAPVITENVRVPETAEIRIVDGYREDWMTTTLKHELGHTLGLEHDDEPSHIMSNEIEDRIPDYHERQQAVTVYGDSFEPHNDGMDSWNASMDAWGDGDYQGTESNAIDAYNAWLEARQNIVSAKRTASSLSERDAENALSESLAYINAILSAADEAVYMARAAARGGDSEPHRRALNDYLNEADRYTYYGTNRIYRAFGFPG